LAVLNANSSFKYETAVHYYLGIFHLMILEMRMSPCMLSCELLIYISS